jgi:phosphoglycerate dehydrogenase-like enzyme
MPENILGALFHITKPYAAAAGDQPAHKWTRRMAVPLNGKTLGILGLGIIGQDLAALAKALRMRVIGTSRRATPLPGLAEVYPTEQTAEVLKQSDFVVLLLPATPATENIVNADFLSHMKPTAWLLNFGRGGAVKDDDLIAAVTQKKIAGAILDVFRQEPLPAEHPFWDTPGISVLPHIGGGYPNRDADVAKLFAQNLGLFLDGKPMLTVVDRTAGY